MRITENRALLYGIGTLVLGGLITGATYAAASDGGSYVIATGLLVFGGLNLLRGIYYQVKFGARRQKNPF